MKKNRIIILTLSLLLTGASSIPGERFSQTDIPADPTQQLNTPEFNGQSIVIAQNNAPTPDRGSQKTEENEDQASESGTAETENEIKSSNNSELKPLKPFKPSEEIAAEQAVDFPVDI
jgi:hypothetical protein